MPEKHTQNAANSTDTPVDTPSQKLKRVPDFGASENDKKPLFEQDASKRIDEWIHEWAADQRKAAETSAAAAAARPVSTVVPDEDEVATNLETPKPEEDGKEEPKVEETSESPVPEAEVKVEESSETPEGESEPEQADVVKDKADADASETQESSKEDAGKYKADADADTSEMKESAKADSEERSESPVESSKSDKPEGESEAHVKPVDGGETEKEAKSSESDKPAEDSEKTAKAAAEKNEKVEAEASADEGSKEKSEKAAENAADATPEEKVAVKEEAAPEPEPKVRIPGVFEKYEPVPEPKYEVDDVALIFEGGGMRAAYTSAAVVALIENGVHFNNVYGVSAGASNAVNYVSWDPWRSYQSFVDFSLDPRFGSTGTLLTHRGLFNADYIYREVSRPGGPLPFDYEAFMNNPARVTVTSFRRDTGETIYFTKDDMTTLDDLMLRVRASSTLPFFMPPVKVDGYVCYDGGLGEGGGIALPKAMADGFEKFFIVRSRPRGYRKPVDEGAGLGKTFFWRRPYAREALLLRPTRYNATVTKIEQLEAEGRAYVVYADEIDVSSSERDIEKLRENYSKGYAQMQRELEDWGAFLDI